MRKPHLLSAISALVTGVAGAGLAASAHATAPAVPRVSTDVTFLGTSYPDAGTGTYTATYNDGPDAAGTISASVQTAPAPFISLNMTGCCSEYGAGGARIDLIYYAELTGPNLGPVPMALFEHLISSASGADAGGWAMMTATGATVGQEIVNSSAGSPSSDWANPGGSTPGTLRFDATPGQEISIEMALNGYVVNGATASSADPYLTIDPSFAAIDPTYSTDYSLTFSPGVVNALAAPGAVPEPATWAMMLLGFGAVGFGMRRRTAGAALRNV